LENLTACENNPNYSFVKGDICDPQIVRQAMANVDIVVHFAAESHVDRSIMDPSVFVKTNVLGTQVLLDAALDANVRRFHHISTDEVFGALDLDDKQRFTEETPYSPRSPYSASKAAADHLVRAYYVTYKLPITITNLMGFDRAVVSDGGIILEEVDMRTMRSKFYPNLYITGDLLNINRPSGGFSLQLCWTTGYIAGMSI